MNIEIKPDTIQVAVSPTGFHLWARQFLGCRQNFVQTEGYSPLPYYLLCHAIELELKARILETHGWPPRVEEVKETYKHNLIKAYKDIPIGQQILTISELAVLKNANDIYRAKGFEYFKLCDAVIGFSNVPPLAELDAIALKLIPTYATPISGG